MGCPAEVEIGDNLVFSVVTHTPATGALTDADAVPAYRVYEDETDPPILTGNMAKLDDDDTTGFYTESIACTSGNGFENGKSYTVYITAAVGAVTGAITYGFKAYDYRTSNVKAISDDTTAPDNLELDYDGTGYAKANSTIGTCSANTDMRGTDNAALAATALSTATWTAARAGYLDELAAANIPTDLANIESDTQDIQSRIPAALLGGRIDSNVGAISEDATAADNLELDYDGTGYVKANSTIGTCTANTDMRGTENAALAATALSTATWTAARAGYLDELSAANIPTDLANIESDTQDIQSRIPAALLGGRIDSNVGAISEDATAADNLELDYDGTGYVKVNSTIGTCTANTDMRGTENAALAATALSTATWTAARAGYLDNLNISETVPTQAQINNQVDAALIDINLDHLMKIAVANNADMTTEVTDGTVLSNIMSKTSDTSSYTVSTDALEAIRDNQAAGGGDASAANQTIIITHLTDMKDNNSGADFDSSTDSLEKIRNRGDAAWITGGGAGGASSVTITIQDQASVSIPDAKVEIWNTSLDALISYATTDSNGQVGLSADDGTYKVRVLKAGYSFDETTDLTVSGTTTQTISGTSTTPSAPAGNQSCRVYEYLYLQDGATPATSVDNAICKILSLPYDSGGVLHSDDPLEGIYNATTGLVYWDVVRAASARFIVKDYGINVVKTVPSQATARLSDIT